MRLEPMVRGRDGTTVRHLVNVDDPAGVALCGRPGPWSPPPTTEKLLKRCEDCQTSHQRQTNHVGGRAWVGR